GPEIFEWSHGLATKINADDGSDPAVAGSGDPRQQTIQILTRHDASACDGIAKDHSFLQNEFLRREVNQIIIRDVVAKRVKETRADHLCPGGQFRIAERIEFYEVLVVLGIFHHKAGGDALALGGNNRPRPFCRGWILPADTELQLLL